MNDSYCPGFPEDCPARVAVDPVPGVHLGGIRCGCFDDVSLTEKEIDDMMERGTPVQLLRKWAAGECG